jgi:hypothetical protein
MATIAQNTVSGVNGPVTLTSTTGGSSDTFAYSSGSKQMLYVNNPTGSPITMTIIGSTAGTISPDGYGGTISVAAGFSMTIAAGQSKILNLDKISAYLSGTITITGGTGLVYNLFA